MIEYGRSLKKNGEKLKKFYIQKQDIKTMHELGIKVPDKIKAIIDKGIKDEELKEFVLFSDQETIEFLLSQHWLREYRDVVGMNAYELELLIKIILKEIEELEKKIKNILNIDEINDIKTELIIKKNELQSFKYLLEDLKKEEFNKGK